MKITKQYLRKIIKEEINKTKIQEGFLDFFSNKADIKKPGGLVVPKDVLERALMDNPEEDNSKGITAKKIMTLLDNLPNVVYLRKNYLYKDKTFLNMVIELPEEVATDLARSNLDMV